MHRNLYKKSEHIYIRILIPRNFFDLINQIFFIINELIYFYLNIIRKPFHMLQFNIQILEHIFFPAQQEQL